MVFGMHFLSKKTQYSCPCLNYLKWPRAVTMHTNFSAILCNFLSAKDFHVDNIISALQDKIPQ